MINEWSPVATNRSVDLYVYEDPVLNLRMFIAEKDTEPDSEYPCKCEVYLATSSGSWFYNVHDNYSVDRFGAYDSMTDYISRNIDELVNSIQTDGAIALDINTFTHRVRLEEINVQDWAIYQNPSNGFYLLAFEYIDRYEAILYNPRRYNAVSESIIVSHSRNDYDSITAFANQILQDKDKELSDPKCILNQPDRVLDIL